MPAATAAAPPSDGRGSGGREPPVWGPGVTPGPTRQPAVIRRGFWLVTGAALGVTGYRRASRLLQSFRPHQAGPGGRVVLPLRGARSPAAACWPAPPGPGAGAAASAAFVRDVREGVAEYLDQQESGTPRTLESQQGRASGETPAS